MSKVISFSISDRYLDKLRSLYPSLTDNLAVKQFVTDGLDSNLGNSLDVSLDDRLDDRVKTLIESWVDGLLDERLDATVGKLITSLSERLSRLEARLDDSLDGRLDDMERLLKLQQSASIASPLPTGEPSPLPPSPSLPPDKLGKGGNGDIFPDSPPSPPDAIEDSEKKIIPLPDTLIVSPIETVESGSESISSINEPGTDAIGPVPGDSSPIEPGKGEGMNPNQAHKYLISKGIEDISYYYLNKWAKAGVIDTSPQGKNAIKHLILRGELYFPKTDQP